MRVFGGAFGRPARGPYTAPKRAFCASLGGGGRGDAWRGGLVKPPDAPAPLVDEVTSGAEGGWREPNAHAPAAMA